MGIKIRGREKTEAAPAVTTVQSETEYWDDAHWVKEYAQKPSASVASLTPAQRREDANKDLCYRTSRWQRLLWREFGDEMAPPEALSQANNDKVEGWNRFERETFSRLYSENVEALPTEERVAESSWAEKAHQAAEQISEWGALRERVRGDQLFAGLAALAVAESVAKALPEPPPEAKEDLERLRQQVEGLEQFAQQGLPVGDQLKASKGALKKAEKAVEAWAEKAGESEMRNAMREAVEQANKQIDDAQESASAFGFGEQAGTAGAKSGTTRERAALLKRVRNSSKLQRIAKEAGRLRRIAARKQRDKVKHTPDEVTDIELGADLGRVLPAELMRLRHPLTRKLFMRDFAERRLLQYRLDGREEEGRGPIIVAIDNSGSMQGQREVWSKAVALAMLEVAIRQKRPFALVHWDTQVSFQCYFKAKETNPSKVLAAMDFFSGGGTDMEAPTEAALKLTALEPGLKKADLILISDGDASPSGAEGFRARAKAVGMTTYGVLISNRERDHNILKAWCDQVVRISDVQNDGAVHDAVFQI